MALGEVDKQSYKDIWVLAEVVGGVVQPVTWELLGAGRNLADTRGCGLVCVLVGSDVAKLAESAIHYGADSVIIVEHQSFATFIEETWAAVLARLINEKKPEVVLAPGTLRGRSLTPRISVLTGSGAGADCTGLDIDPDTGDLSVTRPVYGGNKTAVVALGGGRPQLCTLRHRIFEPLELDSSRSGDATTFNLEESDVVVGKRVLQEVNEEGVEIKLSDANFIISGGRGMRGPEGFALLQDLAHTVNGAVGASRAAVDAGWIAYPHQVGQTGQTVQTRVYFACGISGQVQHLVGMQSSDFIIAINKDPDAPIMKLADVAIVGDLFEVLPEITKRLAQESVG